MIRARIALVAFAMIAAGSPGCRSGSPYEAETQQPHRVGLVVKNDNYTEMDVYAVSDGLPTRIGTVTEDGPAAKAGIKEGDVITKIGDKIVSVLTEYVTEISKRKAGDKVKFTVVRGKETKEIEVVLGPPIPGQGTGPVPCLPVGQVSPDSEPTG